MRSAGEPNRSVPRISAFELLVSNCKLHDKRCYCIVSQGLAAREQTVALEGDLEKRRARATVLE